MFKEEIKISSENGLHARPASLIVSVTAKYKCDIGFIKNEKYYNAKSIISVISMGAKRGDQIQIVAKGEDAEGAIKKVVDIFSGLD
ncbi:MAG: HPr family phosphocarrier protein [Firmicutes bacterium]|nr:HPr family phosphocarrier protein [Bacillota bacterium]